MSDVVRGIRDSFIAGRNDASVAIFFVVSVLMLIIPLPTFMLDIFMSFNLFIGLLIFLTVIYSRRALDFAAFPTILLGATIFGLALNISSTRLILSMGTNFDGSIIRSFSRFVVGAEGTQGLVIGTIIFIIITAVQFIVITKGASRNSEVAARFTLDALPGKQMSLDGAYNQGAITEDVYMLRKKELQMEVDFFGAMDGSSKFVSGNVKVGIFITLVNVIAGLIVGVTLHGENILTASGTYVALAIGDGLVTQIPALLISTASGLIVSKVSTDQGLGDQIAKEFTQDARIFWIAAVVLGVLGILPGFPWYILLPMAGVIGYVAFKTSEKTQAEAAAPAKAEKAASAEASKETAGLVPLDPLSLELGYALIPLVDKEQGAELLERITRIRRESALDLGLVVPRIRIIDNMRLEPSDYVLKIKGVEVGRGAIRMGMYMAINPGGSREEIPGEKTKDPAFGLAALWISEENRDKAERAGFTVVDAPSIIATHLTEIIKKHAGEILGRQEVQTLLGGLKNDYGAVVEEVQKQFGLGEIQKVLQGLLKEQVSIRNLVAILETLGDYGGVTKDTGFLMEKVRQALGRQICLGYADEEKVLRVVTLDPALEQTIIESRDERVGGAVAALEPHVHRAFINSLSNLIKNLQNQGFFPLILCSEAARPLVKSATERDIPDLAVMSVPEIERDIRVESMGQIKLEA